MIRKSGKRFSEKIMLKKKMATSMIQLGWIMLQQTPAQFAKKKAARRRPSMQVLAVGLAGWRKA